MANENEYQFSDESIDYGRRFVLDWKDFAAAVTTLPEYEEKSKTTIINLLGYLPPSPLVYIQYEPFIRSLIAEFEKERLTETKFLEEIEFLIKRIRNDDLKKNGFVGKTFYSDEDYAYYESHLAVYKDAARKRLTMLLGYEPLLKHSLHAEIHLRQLIMEDYYYEGLPIDKVDRRSYTIYHYSKHLMDEGQAEADASPLITRPV